MFSSKAKDDEIIQLKIEIADLKRELDFQKRERASDANTLSLREKFESLQTRIQHFEGRVTAEADARAANDKATVIADYGEKSVALAAKCASDFANATGRLTEQFLAVIKEMKPVCQEAKLTVLPTTVNNDCRVEKAKQ